VANSKQEPGSLSIFKEAMSWRSDNKVEFEVSKTDVLVFVEDCRTRVSRPPQTHVRHEAVDGPSSKYIAQSTLSHQISSVFSRRHKVLQAAKDTIVNIGEQTFTIKQDATK
jgi:hypothetical protein